MNDLRKYLVHLTAPVTTTFKADNYRGEPRWERNAVEALLLAGKPVHSTTKIWLSDLPKPVNLYDMNLDWMDESIQISYGVPHEIHTGVYPAEANPKYRVVQYHDGPTEATKDTFLKYHRNNPGSIVATCCFKSGAYIQKLQNVLGRENVEWTYGPMLPTVFENHDSFSQPNLLWAYRNFCSYADLDPHGMEQLFGRVAGYMRSNPALRLVILAQPHNEISKAALEGDCKAWFLNLFSAREMKVLADRVDVLTNIHWHQVLDIFSKTRLVISPAEPLGGPPFEAASYGIPIVLERSTNPFVDESGCPLFNGLLSASHGFSNEFFNLLDQLYHHQEFYQSHGNLYRSFVKQHATYETYINKLDEIAKKRNWDK